MEGDVSIEAGDKVEDKEKSIIISSTYPQGVSASSSLSEKNLPEKPFTTVVLSCTPGANWPVGERATCGAPVGTEGAAGGAGGLAGTIAGRSA